MKAAVICSKGIGDGLMMMVASHRLQLEGFKVTTFQDSLGELSQWFPNQSFEKRSTIQHLDHFDFLLLQNDNTPFSLNLIKRYREKIHVFYASYEKEKHPPLTHKDYLFDRSLPLVTNIGEGIAYLLGSVEPIFENGLTPPFPLVHRKYSGRIVIHPTSTTPVRTWDKKKFLTLAADLAKQGYDIHFSVSPSERNAWEPSIHPPFSLPNFGALSELAAFLYESHFFIGNESGTGHLASNLGVPTLIVASCPKQMALWRPGFRRGALVTPPSFIPNFKGMRLRNKRWQRWISPRRVLTAFEKEMACLKT